MPHLQEFYQKFKDQGLEIIAVNAGDPAEQVQRYFQESGFTFPAVMGGSLPKYAVGEAYGVQVYPTNYLVDAKTGKIVWRGIGFDPGGLHQALTKLGFK